jgi:hypothetical protein
MRLGRLTLSALLASTLVGAPVVASAAPVAGSRTSTDIEGEGQLIPGAGIWGTLILVAVVVAVGYLAFVEDEDEDLPTSP